MNILGISAFYHDSAAALLQDGEIIAAAQEERFSRKKHDADFPRNAIDFCLRHAGLTIDQVDQVAFYDKPFLKFERLLATYVTTAPRGFLSFQKSMPLWVKEKIFLKKNLLTELGIPSEKLLFCEHHLSHAASAFYPSPFDEAVILTMDGVGEWTTTSVAIGRGNRICIEKEILFPHSLGLFYSAFTYYTGFKVNSGEYKVMGLAPYGKPVYKKKILDHLIDLKEDGSFRLNMDYFDYCAGLRMTNAKFHRLFEGEPRKPDQPLLQKHMDLAASVQAVTEEVVLALTHSIARETGIQNLCLAGGVALNCVANGKVLRAGGFKKIWIQPAAGDAGGSLGAAFCAHHLYLKKPRVSGTDQMKGSYLGPEYTQSEIESALTSAGARFHSLSSKEITECSARALADGQTLGWFQGRMEFGPRALGARSILADPRSRKMQSVLNLKIKFRESFRPFAPAILREDLSDWFEMECDSPYMLLVADIVKRRRLVMSADEEALFGIEKLHVPRSEIPAVTHIDYSARIQTVHRETHPQFYALLSQFKFETGCPVLVNTSFNVRGEPIVETPENAFSCFMGTDLDALAVGNCWLVKSEQDPTLKLKYHDEFELD